MSTELVQNASNANSTLEKVQEKFFFLRKPYASADDYMYLASLFFFNLEMEELNI